VGEGGLAQAWGPVEEEVVERLLPLFRRVHGNAEVVLELLLADELAETSRSKS
jgi:hypothetical protein